MYKKRIITIVGPTATGKSALSVEVAGEVDAEIVSADSMQVFRFMNIGTAKPVPEDRCGIVHHLIDVADPDDEYSAARYAREAGRAVEDIFAKDRTAIVSGGTGLYVRALTDGLFPGPSASPELREGLYRFAEEEGAERLHARLGEVDPEAAGKTHANNVVRVVRALEVYELTGRPISKLQSEHAGTGKRFDAIKVGLLMDREDLYRRIEERTERMVEEGLTREVERLLEMGYARGLKPMQGLGYKEMAAYLAGEITLDDAIAFIKRNTRNYAKRQMTWFKRDKEIKWFAPTEMKAIVDTIKEGLR